MYKKIKVFIFVLIILFAANSVENVLANDMVYGIVLPDDSFEDISGDVNFDCKVNATDALIVLKHSAKILVISDYALHLADINSDGQINAEDAFNILKIAAKI